MTYQLRKLLSTLSGVWIFIFISLLVSLPFIIGIGLFAKSYPILEKLSLTELLFSTEWQPFSLKFGFFPFIMSTIWVTILSIILSAPVCLLAAIYLTQYAHPLFLRIMHPIIDILAGMPSVVYGVWGVLAVVPIVGEHIAPIFGVESTGFSLLSGAIVLAIMTIPYVLNMMIEVFKGVPIGLKEASLSLGATYWETIKFAVLKKSYSGIFSAIGLGIAKAIGETIAVLMVIGNVVQLPKSIFDAAYPLPALIANNYGEMMSIPMYDSALMFAALILFAIVLLFNVLSRYLVNKTETH